jgi:endonuclease/exonuclease/phosphatase family metal-dependent hydrolase
VVHVASRPRKKAGHTKRGAGAQSLALASSAMGGQDAFHSAEDCSALLRRGARAERGAGTARIAEWNVHWFPDGGPGTPSSTARKTDVEWMACALAWMNVDVVALAEVKSRQYSAAAVERLTQRLDELTDGHHIVRVDDCPDQNGQHVAWLINQQRVTATDWQMHASLNPSGDACARQLRPGLGVNLRFPGGLDLHAIAVHLKSGIEARDLALRRASIDAIERVFASVTQRSGDADVLVAGDFNTMGCSECVDAAGSAAEASALDTRLHAFRPAARRIPSDLGCSLYYQHHPSLIDHFVVTSAMQEAPIEQVATVYGHCRELGCESYSGREPDAAVSLSDHCPIVVTLRDEDLD